MLFTTRVHARLFAAMLPLAVIAAPAAADVLNSNLQIDRIHPAGAALRG